MLSTQCYEQIQQVSIAYLVRDGINKTNDKYLFRNYLKHTGFLRPFLFCFAFNWSCIAQPAHP